MGNADNGRKLCSAIAAYMVIKSVINLVLGFSFMNCFWLFLNIVLGIGLVTTTQYANYAVSILLGFLFLKNAKANIDLHQWFYLGEGIIDAVCAVILVVSKDVKAFFGD